MFYPKTDTAGWIQNINSAVEKSQIDVILPVFELGIRKLIVHQAQLKHIDKLCPLPGLKEFEIAIEKGALYLHLKKNGIACPKSVIVKSKSIPEDLNFDFRAFSLSYDSFHCHMTPTRVLNLLKFH